MAGITADWKELGQVFLVSNKDFFRRSFGQNQLHILLSIDAYQSEEHWKVLRYSYRTIFVTLIKQPNKFFLFSFFKKKIAAFLFLCIGFNCLNAEEPLPEDSLLFAIKSPGVQWYSFRQPWKNEKLTQPWSRLVVIY